MSSFRVIVKESPDGDLYIDLPPELLDSLGWSNYDSLMWVVEDDGTIYLRKNNDNDSSN